MKAIVIIRTSTVRQEIESQKQEVISWAKGEGWKERDIIVIGDSGASAIKLDDLYLKNMAEIEKHILSGNIGCVFAWSLDRIGRNEETLMRFKNMLIENKVQLKTKNPSLTLLNDDGTVNSGMELAFSLFVTMAKQEMEQKKARFKRAKDYMKASGKLPQGKPIKGYYLDKDRTIEVDEVEAEFVRGIFNDYLNGNESLNSIHEKYSAKGFFEPVVSKYRNAGKNRVWSMLKDPSYCGEAKINKRKVTKKVNGKEVVGYAESTITYPAIITKELYDAVQEKLRGRKAQPKHDHKNIYYAKELVRCAKCGNSMKVHSTDKTYTCKEQKGHTVNVSVNVIDYIAWEMAKAWFNYYGYINWGERMENYKNKAYESTVKLDNVTKEIERLTARKQSINKRFFSERNDNRELMSEEDFDSLIDEINVNLKGLGKKKVEYENEINRYNELASQAGTNVLPDPQTLEMMDDSQRVKEVIKKVIKTIKVERYDENKADYKIIVEPTDIISPLVDNNWYWEYFSKQRYVVLHIGEEHSEKRTFTRRFEARKRERAKLAKTAKG